MSFGVKAEIVARNSRCLRFRRFSPPGAGQKGHVCCYATRGAAADVCIIYLQRARFSEINAPLPLERRFFEFLTYTRQFAQDVYF